MKIPVSFCTCFMLLLSIGCATESSVPDNLRITGPVIARVHAQGFQIYDCSADPSGKLIWTLNAPQAQFSGDGLSGTHSAGPTWKASDGSKVVGKKIAEHPSPSGDAVPWLLLSAASHEGAGKLSNVSYIQRLNTVGGKAPSFEDSKPGDQARIPYAADYVFFGPGASQ